VSQNDNNPLVSICMPLYNAEDFIGETIKKLKEQSYQNIEIIIVNDHSTDNSVNIVKSFNWDKIKLFTNTKKGACSARNYAFTQSTGDYIKFLDSDDFCSQKMIERQVKTLQGKSKKSLVFSPLKLLFPDGSFLEPKRSIDHDYDVAFDLQIEIMKFGGTNIPYCYLMSRELVEATGGWDETVLKNQDGEYFSRVLAHGDKAFSVSDEFVIYRKTGVGISSKLSKERTSSMLKTYGKVISLSIEKYDTEQMRKICGR
jgi:glycosyltransferase involved in cell wall biosynthesis